MQVRFLAPTDMEDHEALATNQGHDNVVYGYGFAPALEATNRAKSAQVIRSEGRS